MIEHLFNWLTLAMNARFEIAMLAAIGWGVTSIILSPCHLSSIPLVIGYLSSQGREGLKRPYSISFVFATGILVTIALIGALTASAGRMLGDVGVWGNIVVAGVFFIVGLYLMDLIKLPGNGIIPQTFRVRGWKGAFLLGLIFGIGLGPCTFAYMAPVLGMVFTVAAAHPFQGLSLIAAFGIGHCAVIVGAGGAAGTVQKYLNWTDRSKGALWLKRGAGMLVMLGGVYYIYAAI
jgi:cytochrome c-type biogenesis protein